MALSVGWVSDRRNIGHTPGSSKALIMGLKVSQKVRFWPKRISVGWVVIEETLIMPNNNRTEGINKGGLINLTELLA